LIKEGDDEEGMTRGLIESGKVVIAKIVGGGNWAEGGE